MDIKKAKKRSQFFSQILRHRPEKIGIKLEDGGWTDIEEFLEKISNYKNGAPITFEELEYVVINNDKKRFSFNEDKTKIRARAYDKCKYEL